jgi:WD40 repeat protein
VLHTFDGFRCAVKVAKFSPDGKLLAASGNDGMLKLYDVKSYKELKSMVHRESPNIDMATYALIFSRDGKQIYAANGDGTISVWDVASGKEIRNWQAHPNIVVWNAKTGEKLFTLGGHKFDINGVIFTPDDRYLLTGGIDATIKFWDMRDGQLTRTIIIK